LLVFSYLIVPALAGIILGGGVGARLFIGWAFGTLVSVIAMLASAAFDLPTGATVVCAFGLSLLALGGLVKATGWPRRLGRAALAPRPEALAGARRGSGGRGCPDTHADRGSREPHTPHPGGQGTSFGSHGSWCSPHWQTDARMSGRRSRPTRRGFSPETTAAGCRSPASGAEWPR